MAGSGIVLKQVTAATIPTPDAGKDTIYVESATGFPSYKDDTGATHLLAGAVGPAGAQGPMGPPGSAIDGDDGDNFLAMPGQQGASGSAGATGLTGPVGPPLLSDDGLDGDQGFPGVITQGGTQGFSGWILAATHVFSAEASFDFTNLGNFNDLLIMLVGVTLASTGDALLRISTDNGSTFDSSSGDYQKVTGAGAATATTSLQLWGANATTARSGFWEIQGLRVAAPKHSHSNMFSTDSVHFQYVNLTVTTINAIRILNSGAGNFTGGTVYLLGR